MKASQVGPVRAALGAGLFLILLGFVSAGIQASGNPDNCRICKKPLMNQIYLWMDKVTGEQERLCGDCINLPNCCYVCSIPLRDNYTDLKDTRFICARDLKSVML